jgi:hypothetical protein
MTAMFLLSLISGITIRKKCSLENLKGRDYHVKMNLKEMGRDGVNWIFVAQDRGEWRAVVNTAMNLRVP